MSKHSRTEYSYLNILAGVGGYSVSIILSLFNRMVFTRTLPADYLGINGLFTNILSVLSLAELGIGGAIVYALYKPLAEDDHEKVASIVKLFGKAYAVIGTVIFAAGLCLMPFLTLIVGEHPEIPENLYLIFGLFLFNTASSYFFTYRSTLLTAAQQNYYNTGINYLILSIQEVIQATYLLLTHEYIGYLIIQVIGGLAYNIIISKVAVKKHPYIVGKAIKPLPKEDSQKIFKDVRDLTIYKISGLLVNSTDNILITYFKGLALTGLTSNYTLLVTTLNSLIGQVFGGITASVGNHNATETVEKKHETFLMLDFLNFWIFGWAALGICFCSTDLVALFFGSNYTLPAVIPLIMAIIFYISGTTNVVGIYKHTMGMFKYGRFIQIGTGILNIILSIIMGNIWGLSGILIATAISRALTHMWYTPYVVYKYAFQKSLLIYIKKHGMYLGSLLLAGLVCEMVLSNVIGPVIVSAIVRILLCSVVFNAMVLALFSRTQEFNRFKQCGSFLFRKILKRKS